MARLSKEEKARYEGAEWCLRMIEEKGIEETKKDLMNRGAQNCPLGLLESDKKKFFENQFNHIYRSMLTLSLITLKDEFEFDIQDLRRYILRFENKAGCINVDLASWDDFEQMLAEEAQVKIENGRIYI